MKYGELWQVQGQYPRQEGHTHSYGPIVDRVHEGTVILRCVGCERPEAFPMVDGKPEPAHSRRYSYKPESLKSPKYTMVQ